MHNVCKMPVFENGDCPALWHTLIIYDLSQVGFAPTSYVEFAGLCILSADELFDEDGGVGSGYNIATAPLRCVACLTRPKSGCA